MKTRLLIVLGWLGFIPMFSLILLWAIAYVLTGKFYPSQYMAWICELTDENS